MDLSHILAATASAIVGVLAGLIAGIWRAGHIKENVKREVAEELGEKMTAAVHEIEDKIGAATEAFDETLKGLRQKINDVELNTAREFLRKDDFGDFREEYRQDMRRVLDKLDRL